MKAWPMAGPSSRCPGCRPFYSSARTALRLRVASCSKAGSGTALSMVAPWSGPVPQVNHRRDLRGVQADGAVEHGVGLLPQFSSWDPETSVQALGPTVVRPESAVRLHVHRFVDQALLLGDDVPIQRARRRHFGPIAA